MASPLLLVAAHSESSLVGNLRGIISTMKKPRPSSDLLVGAKARLMPKDPPIANTCLRVEDPAPHGQWKNGWSMVLDHPEDHRRAVTRRGINR